MSVFNGIPKKRIFVDIFFSIFWSLLSAIFSDSLATIINQKYSNDNVFLSVVIYFTIYIIVWGFLEFLADVHAITTNAIIECNVSKYYFNKLYYIKPSILKETNTGYISGVLNKLINHQVSFYEHIALFATLSLVFIIYFIIKMWLIHWALGLSLIAIVVIASLFRYFVSRKAIVEAEQLTKLEGERNKLTIDIISNINTVQKMRSLDFMNLNLDLKNNICLKQTKVWAILSEIGFCGCKSLSYLYTPLAIFIYNYLHIQNEQFYPLLVVVSIQIVHQTKAFLKTIERSDKFLASYNKMHSIVKEENKRKPIYTGDFKTLEIADFSYSYNKKNEDNSKLITINIPHFSFDKGDKVCIYGESGQGKTTLLHLISGEIENDKTYINKEVNDEYLECVFIAQDTEIFDMSLRDNLTLGKEVPDDKLISYLNLVGMGEWLSSQKDGLDTLLGERGVFVSTGQRQRLNLLRGLLISDKEVYLLDEPTSNVDETTEKNMIELIYNELKDKTVIIVTHRPNLKNICNKIYKFEQGCIFLEETKNIYK